MPASLSQVLDHRLERGRDDARRTVCGDNHREIGGLAHSLFALVVFAERPVLVRQEVPGQRGESRHSEGDCLDREAPRQPQSPAMEGEVKIGQPDCPQCVKRRPAEVLLVTREVLSQEVLNHEDSYQGRRDEAKCLAPHITLLRPEDEPPVEDEADDHRDHARRVLGHPDLRERKPEHDRQRDEDHVVDERVDDADQSEASDFSGRLTPTSVHCSLFALGRGGPRATEGWVR